MFLSVSDVQLRFGVIQFLFSQEQQSFCAHVGFVWFSPGKKLFVFKKGVAESQNFSVNNKGFECPNTDSEDKSQK